jgi:hypothetical protein
MSNKKTYSSIVTITFIDNNGKTNGVANILKDYSSIKECIDSLQCFRKQHKCRYKDTGFGEMYGISIDEESYENILVSYELISFDGKDCSKKLLYLDNYEYREMDVLNSSIDYILRSNNTYSYKLTTNIKINQSEIETLKESF